MAKVARQTLDASGIEPGDLAAFIPHQANMRIIDELAKQLKLPETVVIARDIELQGNTSAASIPLAMHSLLAERPELSGGLALHDRFWRGPRVRRPDHRTSVAVPSRAPRAPCRLRGQSCEKLLNEVYYKPPSNKENPMAFSNEEVLAGLAELVNDETGIAADVVALDKSFTDDLDIDSISMMTIVVNAEEKFDVKIPDEEVKDLKTVGDAVDFIVNQA